MGFSGPANLLEWVLLASGLAAFLVMGIGLQRFFVTPQRHERQAILFQESSLAIAVLHAVGIITRRGPGEDWTTAGIALYGAAMVVFLAAMDVTRGATLPRAFATSGPATPLITTGIYAVMRHPVDLAYSLAWMAAPVATHSPTLSATAIVMVVLHVVAARRHDRQMAEQWPNEYRAYRRWWR